MRAPVAELVLGETGASTPTGEDALPRTYDAKFRRWVLELVRAGRPVRMAAAA
jgi:hypothetical protein